MQIQKHGAGVALIVILQAIVYHSQTDVLSTSKPFNSIDDQINHVECFVKILYWK